MIAFVLAFGLGANDVANSFGTSVGSKVLTLKAACTLATIFEISGSVLLGGQVSATIRGGIINPNLFNETSNGALLLMYGQLASLASSCIWMLVATFFKLPVSGSHSIVGATAGFGLVLFGLSGIQWIGVLRIVISWFVSPLLSGLVSTFIFFILKKIVLTKEHPLEPGLCVLPFFYGATVIINVFSVLYGGLSIFGIREIKLWIVLVASFGAGILTGLIVFFFIRPYLRRKILRRLSKMECPKEDGDANLEETPTEKFRRRMRGIVLRIRHPNQSATSGSSSMEFVDQPEQASSVDAPPNQGRLLEFVTLESNGIASTSPELLTTDNPAANQGQNYEGGEANVAGPGERDDDSSVTEIESEPLIEDRPEEVQVFSFAQILSAIFGSFVHGANDVSNAVGPVVGLWLVAISGNPLESAPPPIWILFYGGVGISIGLWVWGRKVMETVGSDLTTITPSSGVCIEVGSAVTVLIASNLGIPISTTHCKVGSVVCVGRFRAKSNVNWRLFINIVIAWVLLSCMHLPELNLSCPHLRYFTPPQSLFSLSSPSLTNESSLSSRCPHMLQFFFPTEYFIIGF
uniref:Phosphate transporter n=1 Tax=Echinococcus granulosus TaxID=6210 RepID=A0A068WHB0_ECHGR|nr:sodium dependent phosphate transporter 2 [Echinococcus granulosus]